MIDDVDLSRVAVPLNPDGSPGPGPGTWPVGGLVAVNRSDGGGGALWTVDHNDGDQLPPECCAQLPHDVTGAVA